jgi:hypothetical protein
MPRIAPPILRADIHDERVRLLTLGLQIRKPLTSMSWRVITCGTDCPNFPT